MEGEDVVKYINSKLTGKRIIISSVIIASLFWTLIVGKQYIEYRQTQDIPITIGEIDYTYSINTTGSWNQTFFLEIEMNNEILSYAYYGDVFGFNGYEVEVVQVYETSEAKYYEILFKVKSSDIDDNEIWWISRSRHFIEEKNNEHNFIDKVNLGSDYDFLEDILNEVEHMLYLHSNFTNYDDWISPNYTE